jgi:RNA recognition motif-containing protein
MTPRNVGASIAPHRDELMTNDNSNPQQGTSLPLEVKMDQTPAEAQTKAPESKEAAANRPNMRSPPNRKDHRKLFVGGLPADVTEDEFRVFFEQFGEIVDSVVMFDRETHRSRGFGFVTFESADVANMLLNMGQGEGEDENGDGKAEDATKAPRVGRLVMRGKTCEVKAAEPKDSSSRSNRRGFQNQGGSTGTANSRRFVEKVYPQQATQGASAPQINPYHYMGGHHYPMASPSYYPGYNPGMYQGAAGYHTAPMYSPVAHNSVNGDGLHHPYVPIATPIEGAHVAPYMEGVHEHGHAYNAAAYGHPQMIHQVYYPHAMHPQAPTASHPQAAGTYPTPGTPASAMHPTAPGLPNKDE